MHSKNVTDILPCSFSKNILPTVNDGA